VADNNLCSLFQRHCSRAADPRMRQAAKIIL